MTSTSLATSSSAIGSSKVSDTAPLTPRLTTRNGSNSRHVGQQQRPQEAAFSEERDVGNNQPSRGHQPPLHQHQIGDATFGGDGGEEQPTSNNTDFGRHQWLNNNNNNNDNTNNRHHRYPHNHQSQKINNNSDVDETKRDEVSTCSSSAALISTAAVEHAPGAMANAKLSPDVMCDGINNNSSSAGHMITVPPFSNNKSDVELSQMPGSVMDEIYNSADADGSNLRDDDSASTESRYVVPPDGGWGWVVVAASFFICFIVDSVAYSYPMIYANMASLPVEEGPVAFFIGATLMALYMITAPFASALVNVYGTRRVIVLGSILTSTGLIVSSRTAENDFYWLILTFGVMGGVGLGMMYIGAMVSVGTYFDKRRPLALALAVCGSGLGMGIFPLVAHHLFDHFGLGPALELYACFVLQGAWLGMLVWPLPPRPLHACAKPRRKDLLDRVTEWVDKLRHREDSCDSLADPETIAERNKMVRAAAKYRISGLQRYESGLATPPTTPGSSLSIATTATPPATRGRSLSDQNQQPRSRLNSGGNEDDVDNDNDNNNNNNNNINNNNINTANNGFLVAMMDPLAISPISPVGCAASFRRCQSLAVSRLSPNDAAAKSCPQFQSLLWTPHANHIYNAPISYKETVTTTTTRNQQEQHIEQSAAAVTLCHHQCSVVPSVPVYGVAVNGVGLPPSTSSSSSPFVIAANEQHVAIAQPPPRTPPSSVHLSRRQQQLMATTTVAASHHGDGNRAISEEHLVSSSSPYSSRSTSGVVCELADLADQQPPLLATQSLTSNVDDAVASYHRNHHHDHHQLPRPQPCGCCHPPPSSGAPPTPSSHLLLSTEQSSLLSSSAATNTTTRLMKNMATNETILDNTQSFPLQNSQQQPSSAQQLQHRQVTLRPCITNNNSNNANSRPLSSSRHGRDRLGSAAVVTAAAGDGSGDAAVGLFAGSSFPIDTRKVGGRNFGGNYYDETSNTELLATGGCEGRHAGGGAPMTGTTVTSSSSDFAILAASKPMPLLSAGCCVCIKKALEQSLDISLLRDSRFWILAIGNITAMMGLYQIIFVLPALAAYADNDDSQHITSVIMAVFGVTHTIGRVLTGVMSGPRFRPLLLCNTAFVLSMAVFAVFAIAQEPLLYPVLCALAALHGLCYAFFAVLSTVIIVNVFGVRKLSSCFGMITLARGMAPYLTTLAYQVAYNIGTNSNIIGGGGGGGSSSGGNIADSASSSSSFSPSSTNAGDVSSLLLDGGGTSASTSVDSGVGDMMTVVDRDHISSETRYIQRTYGVAGLIYVGIAFAFHLLLHFRYFKRRLLDVQRKPRPRLRCVSVPTPSSLSGYRLPTGRSLGDDDDIAEETQSIGVTSTSVAVMNQTQLLNATTAPDPTLAAKTGGGGGGGGGNVDGNGEHRRQFTTPLPKPAAGGTDYNNNTNNEADNDDDDNASLAVTMASAVILTPPLVYPFDVNHDHQRYDIFNNNNINNNASGSNNNSRTNCYHRRTSGNNSNNDLEASSST